VCDFFVCLQREGEREFWWGCEREREREVVEEVEVERAAEAARREG
jgi:hypothetical protein